MAARRRALVVGGSGRLGTEIVRQLRQAGLDVLATVRASATAPRRTTVESLGATVCPMDLKDRDSIREACRGVRVVLSTASATVSRGPGDSIQSVDKDGQLTLVEIAESMGVERLVFVSFPPSSLDHPLQSAKQAVEERLRRSSMQHAIVRATKFMETWLGPALGFDPAHGRARIFGSGTQPVSWVSLYDVARFAVAASDGDAFMGKTVQVCGPEALTYHDVVRIFEERGGPKVSLEYVPETALQSMFDGAMNPLDKTHAALMLGAARGQAFDPGPALELLAGRLRSVEQYADQMLGHAP